MSQIKPLIALIKNGDLDTTARPLMVRETIHRTSLMPVLRGREPEGQSDFKDPTGVLGYYGFGADGYYYENGVQGRAWKPEESIDDFTDVVTDTERWTGIGNDFSEGAIDRIASAPFGKRLFCEYVGPGVEVYDRKGTMVFSHPASGDKAILSARVTTFGEGAEQGSGIEQCILLAVQQQGSDSDYIFVGYCNSVTYPFSVIHGHVTGGVPAITASVALPPDTQEVDVAINVDSAGTYRGYYNVTGVVSNYTGPSWSAVGAAEVLPGGWPTNAVPRIHASFSTDADVGERHSLSDVRVEIGGGIWEGQQRASWWLEILDGGNPGHLAGTRQDCPDELLINWERSLDEECALTLVDMDTPSDPKLWRRWDLLSRWKDRDRAIEPESPWWSPGWMDAHEGHIVMTRDTLHQNVDEQEGKGEVWIVSLRWDKSLIFNTQGIGRYLTYYDRVSGRSLRESGSWGARRYSYESAWHPEYVYDKTQDPSAFPFVGTMRNGNSEVLTSAVTYGVNIRKMADGTLVVAYGIQEYPVVYPGEGKYFGATLKLSEGGTAHERRLFRKDVSGYDVWDQSDEAWVMVGLSNAGVLYWNQAREDGPFDELLGVLCRKDFTVLAPDNLSTAPYTEDTSWEQTDRFGAKGINLFVMDSNPVGSEVVAFSSGWFAGSHLAMLWYNSGDPNASVVKTYGHQFNPPAVSYNMDVYSPDPHFPNWFNYIIQDLSSELDRSRLTLGPAKGADSFVSIAEGMWLCYGHFLGGTAITHRNDVIRGGVIDRSDFVLDLKGRFIPPFAAGNGFQAIDSMSSGQRYECSLRILGEKRLFGRIGLVILGNGSGTGGVTIESSLSYVTGGGKISSSNAYTPGGLASTSGSLFHVRVKRVANIWKFMYYDVDQSLFVTILEVVGLRGPVVPLVSSILNDAPGLAAGVGVELTSLTLAPMDDALGSLFYRPVDIATLPSNYAANSAGAVLRENVPSSGSGQIVVGDSWFFPGIMPRP